MAGLAIWAIGTQVQIGDGGSPENFTAIAELTDIGGPAIKANMIDVTSHDTPGGWDQRIPGVLSAGDLKLTLNFVPTNATQNYAAGLIHKMVNRIKTNFKLVFPDTGNTTWSFAAYVSDFEPKAPVKSQLSAACTLAVTGQPTLS